MKYSKEQRLYIGRRIYDGEINCYQAAEQYKINHYTARDYMKMYRDTNQLPKKIKTETKSKSKTKTKTKTKTKYKTNFTFTTKLTLNNSADLQKYQDMSREELLQALILARITEERLKMGYEVKEDGSIIRYVRKNSK